MNLPEDFDSHFGSLTGHAPFPWQRALFGEFLQNRFPKTCDIPTGLGKTSIIAIWLLAMAHHVRFGTVDAFPRRLVYVVNRRTVVDQATHEAERMREALATKPELQAVAYALQSLGVRHWEVPLAISTLRGQFADNAEWRNDPARAAVVVGTVDMVGSRLLFGGYGCGFKSRPLHAGFLGQNTLLVHDEAHLEPAFQKLISAIESEQQRCREFARFRVVALTATSRSDNERFQLTDADRNHHEVRKRIGARKGIAFVLVEDRKEIADDVAQRALEYKNSGQAILIFLRRLEDVEKVADKLDKSKLPVQVLTGTLRGLERDALAKDDAIFGRFLPEAGETPQQGTVFLVCTSAGEVGVDISADHLVCDLTPFDSMAQRFGRVNRFGEGDARIDIIHLAKQKKEDEREKEVPIQVSAFERACEKTFSILQNLPQREDHLRNASPATLGNLPVSDRLAAFTPEPETLPTSEILFDAWTLTSVRQRLPGRPPVADWLHGVAEWEPPETYVAWREEVECLTGGLLERYEPEDLLEDYPLKPHELLRDRTSRVMGHLKTMAQRCPELFAWLIEPDGKVRVLLLTELSQLGERDIADCALLLPPRAGGLEKGLLSGNAPFDEARRESYDVSDQWRDQNKIPRRCRTWDDENPAEGMRLVRTIDTRPDADDMPDEDEQASRRRYWHWHVRPHFADDDGSRTASYQQDLEQHHESAKSFAGALVAKLGLGDPEASAVILAARWHDLGKGRAIWQRSIGNRDYPQRVLAKSGGKMRPIDLNDYRHELGSLSEVSSLPEFLELEPEKKELVLHLIAAHHGRARPHFPADEVFDPEHAEEVTAGIAREVPRRFARLQAKYGRWGLAYLESLVRAADVLASQPSGGEESRRGGRNAKPSVGVPR